MSPGARNRLSVSSSAVMAQSLAVWNRRLLLAAAIFVLWAATVLTLQAAGPDAQAMVAGEGMLITVAR